MNCWRDCWVADVNPQRAGRRVKKPHPFARNAKRVGHPLLWVVKARASLPSKSTRPQGSRHGYPITFVGSESMGQPPTTTDFPLSCRISVHRSLLSNVQRRSAVGADCGHFQAEQLSGVHRSHLCSGRRPGIPYRYAPRRTGPPKKLVCRHCLDRTPVP
jgi:hypothetical protein